MNKALLVISILISVLILEIGCRLFTPFPVHPAIANRVPHDKLKYIVSPDLPDIDSNGFRNKEINPTPDIVTIGDSHTFGYNVPREDNWPTQLARRSGLSVYNFGVGGYGILQYAYLFDKAMEKTPHYILLGLYPTNDLSDYCRAAVLPYWEKELEKNGMNVNVCKPDKKHKVSLRRKLRNYKQKLESLITSTAIGSAIDYYYTTRFIHGEGSLITYGSHEAWVSEFKEKIFTQQMNLESDRISEGMKASKYYFNRMVNMARSNNIKFGVLLIPSRERALYDYAVDNNIEIDGRLKQLVNNENILVEKFKQFFRKRNTVVVDVKPYLQVALDKAVENDMKLYPLVDGHPFKIGYEAYTDAAEKVLTVIDAQIDGDKVSVSRL